MSVSEFKMMVTAKPLGAILAAETVPLHASTPVFTIASPKPTPPESRSLEGSGREKGRCNDPGYNGILMPVQ